MSAAGPGAWTTLHRSPVGDPRASSQNDLQAEFLGDYVYADATNTYGTGVWNDVRAGQDCPAIDTWRQELRDGTAEEDPPNPATSCPPCSARRTSGRSRPTDLTRLPAGRLALPRRLRS